MTSASSDSDKTDRTPSKAPKVENYDVEEQVITDDASSVISQIPERKLTVRLSYGRTVRRTDTAQSAVERSHSPSVD